MKHSIANSIVTCMAIVGLFVNPQMVIVGLGIALLFRDRL
jgi:hypothetical protein